LVIVEIIGLVKLRLFQQQGLAQNNKFKE